MSLILKPIPGLLPNWDNNPCGIPAPVGAWVMNEGSGGKIYDLSGNGSNGIVKGGLLWANSSLYFPGTSGDHIDIDSFRSAGHGASTTHSWFIKIKPANINYIYDQASPRMVLSLGENGDFYDGTAWRTIYPALSDIDQTLCVVANASKATVKGYIDGLLQSTDTYSPRAIATSGEIAIGAHYTGGSPAYQGNMDVFYIFTVALSPTQIQYLYQHPYYAWEYPELWELYVAAGAPGIDERDRLIPIISTITGSDIQAYKDLLRQINIVSALSGTDIQAYKDIEQLISIASTLSGTDLQAYKEVEKQISIITTISGTDIQAYKELQRLIEIVSVIQGSDIQAYKETEKQIIITATITSTDIQGFIESLLINITSTISASDSLSYNERNRTIPITATVSITDIQAYKDLVDVLIAATLSSTDLQAYKEVGTIPISTTLSATDFQFYIDEGTISIICTISGTDSLTGDIVYSDVRMEFILQSRTKDFVLQSRTKDFVLQSRTKDFILQ